VTTSTRTTTKTKTYKEPDQPNKICQELINSIDKGVDPWIKEWRVDGAKRPTNFVTGDQYQNSNICLLDLYIGMRGYSSSYFAGYKQGQDLGLGKVRSGEKACYCIQPQLVKKIENEGKPDQKDNSFMIYRYRPVFNLDQWDTTPAKKELEKKLKGDHAPGAEVPIYAKAEETIRKYLARHKDLKFRYSGDRNFFNSELYQVTIADRDRFYDESALYSTIFHELGHATSRPLERKMGNGYGSADYAYEEMLVEAASFQVAVKLDVPKTKPDSHASYLDSWSKCLRLKDGPKTLIKALTKSTAIANYILNEES
tara:strand:+ start:2547 stop:3482 length:936 start_codon:yes stop_codon:yes gene_type:complete